MTLRPYVRPFAFCVACGVLVLLALSLRLEKRPPGASVPATTEPAGMAQPPDDEIAKAEAPAAPSVQEKAAASSRTPRRARAAMPAPESPAGSFELPMGEWKDVGSQTPQAAFETFLWAVQGGDVERVRELLSVGGKPANFEAYLNKLSPETRATHGTPEQIAALMMCDNFGKARPFEKVELLPPYSEGGTVIWIHFKNDAGMDLVHPVDLRHTSDGWRIHVPEYKLRGYLTRGHDSSGLFLPKK